MNAFEFGWKLAAQAGREKISIANKKLNKKKSDE